MQSARVLTDVHVTELSSPAGLTLAVSVSARVLTDVHVTELSRPAGLTLAVSVHWRAVIVGGRNLTTHTVVAVSSLARSLYRVTSEKQVQKHEDILAAPARQRKR